MIRDDSLSQMLTILAICICLYLATFETSAIVLFPAVLLLSGMSMQYFMLRRVEPVDSMLEESTMRTVSYYTVISLVALGISSQVIRQIPSQLAGYSALLYTVLMAIAEERFFRGFVTNWLASKIQPMLAVVGSATIFVVYHTARYGWQPEAFAYVFVAGIVLAWVAMRSGRLSPVMLGHIVNNIAAVIM